MATTQYIGARYVPLFAEPLDWDKTNTYEALTIVYYGGNSYTSRQAVPKNIDISNTTYWALTGNYNAQIEQYRKEVLTVQSELEDIQKVDADQETRITNNTNELKKPFKIIDATKNGCDNTGKTDCSDTINNLLKNNKPCTIYFPEGTYLLNSPIVMQQGCTILGANMSYTLFNCAKNGITFDSTHGASIRNCQFEGSYNATAVANYGMILTNTDVCYFENLVFQNFNTGILNQCTSGQHGNNKFNYIGINVTKTMNSTTYGLFVKGKTVSNYYCNMFIASNLGGQTSNFWAVNCENTQDQHFEYVDTANGYFGFRFNSDSKLSNNQSDIYMTNCVVDSFWYGFYSQNNTVVNTNFHDNCVGNGTSNYNVVFGDGCEGSKISNSGVYNLNSTTDNMGGMSISSSLVTVDNCTFNGFGNAIHFNKHHEIISNNSFINCDNGIYLETSNYSTIIGNTTSTFTKPLCGSITNANKCIITNNVGVFGGDVGNNVYVNNVVAG